jgi:hypothetical protein
VLPAAFPPGGGPDAVCLPEQHSTGLLVPPAVLIPGCARWLLAALPDAGSQRGGYQLVSTATSQNFHPPPGPGTGSGSDTIIARVTSTAGQGAPNVTVSWSTSTGSVSPTTAVTDGNGYAQTGVSGSDAEEEVIATVTASCSGATPRSRMAAPHGFAPLPGIDPPPGATGGVQRGSAARRGLRSPLPLPAPRAGAARNPRVLW